MSYADLAKEANQYSSVLTEIRRELHQIPEFGLQLPKTLARVLESVHGLGEITLSKTITSAVLRIQGGQPGPTRQALSEQAPGATQAAPSWTCAWPPPNCCWPRG